MQESSFFKLFSLLEKKQIRLFQKYLACVHEDQKTARMVLEYFAKHPEKVSLQTDRIYHKIFGRPLGEDKSDRKNFLNTLSDLHLWLKEFLMNENLRNNKLSRELVWILTVMEDPRLPNEELKVRKLKLQVNEGSRTGSFDYLRGLVANYLLLHREKPALDMDVIQQFNEDLDNYYLLMKVKTACEIANSQNLNPWQFSEILPEGLISMIKKSPPAHRPLLRIYLEVYHLLIHQTDEIYNNITNQLVFFYNRIPASETHQILRYLLNFASKKTKEGVESYWAKTHELNKLAYKTSRDGPEKVMTPAQYLNVISAAARENDFDWAEEFMNEKAGLLSDKKKETMLLARAVIIFGKKEYKTVKNLLFNVEFDDVLSEIRAKTIFLMADYEIKEDPSGLLADCIKFDSFLLRQRIDYQKVISPFRSFSKILKMLIKCRDPQDLLLKKIKEDKMITSRAWLMEKAGTYEQKFFRKGK